MVTRVHGHVQQGIWVEKDVKIVTIGATGATFLNDLAARVSGELSAGEEVEAVNSALEQVTELVAQRGTILGINVASDTSVVFMVGYANAFTVGNTQATSGSVEEAISVQVDAIVGLSSPTVAVAAGFAGATPGVPTPA